MKSPFLAAVLSMLWLGLGQVYNGQLWKGFILWLCMPFALFGGPLVVVPWIIGIIEAYIAATNINNELMGKQNNGHVQA